MVLGYSFLHVCLLGPSQPAAQHMLFGLMNSEHPFPCSPTHLQMASEHILFTSTSHRYRGCWGKQGMWSHPQVHSRERRQDKRTDTFTTPQVRRNAVERNKTRRQPCEDLTGEHSAVESQEQNLGGSSSLRVHCGEKVSERCSRLWT